MQVLGHPDYPHFRHHNDDQSAFSLLFKILAQTHEKHAECADRFTEDPLPSQHRTCQGLSWKTIAPVRFHVNWDGNFCWQKRISASKEIRLPSIFASRARPLRGCCTECRQVRGSFASWLPRVLLYHEVLRKSFPWELHIDVIVECRLGKHTSNVKQRGHFGEVIATLQPGEVCSFGFQS